MMYAIQNMELRSNHARSGSLHENKSRLCDLEIILVKKTCSFAIRELLVVYLQLYANLWNTYVIFCYLHIAASKWENVKF